MKHQSFRFLEDDFWNQRMRCASGSVCSDSFSCHISETHIETPFSEIPVLPRLFAFACTILISRWSFFRLVRALVHSQCLALRRIVPRKKKAKSSKKRRRGRLPVAYRSTRIDLKCLARKFVGKLITFHRLRFNCTSCEWALEMHRRRSNRMQATTLATGSPQAFRLWKLDTCLYRTNASSRSEKGVN